MREEKEVLLIVSLLNRKENSLFKKEGTSKKKFEEYANYSVNNKDFIKWFKLMVEKDCIKFIRYEDNLKGIPTKFYIINRKKMINHLNTLNFYKNLYDIAVEDYFSLR